MFCTYLTVTLGMVLIAGVAVILILQNIRKTDFESSLNTESDSFALLYSAVSEYPGADGMLDRYARSKDLSFTVSDDGDLYSQYGTDGKWAGLINCTVSDSGPITTDRNAALGFRTMTLSKRYSYAGREFTVLSNMDISCLRSDLLTQAMGLLIVAIMSVICTLLITYYVSEKMIEPFEQVRSVVKRYSKGDFNTRIPEDGTLEVNQLAKSFNNMADQLKDLENSRRSFVSNVGHELRSPLTSIRGFLEAMLDGTISEADYPHYIDIVFSEVKRMITMVNDLLDLARIESGKTALRLEVFDINELIRRTLITFEARISEQRMDVDVKFANEQYLVEADNAQISQVLRNLIDNAIKYSPAGRKLRIATYSYRREVFVSIQDFGQGIPEEDIDHVFDRFYKVEKAHTPSKQSGTGLGLSIVKKIIEQHGQSITLKSVKGKGSTFTFSLKRVMSSDYNKSKQGDTIDGKQSQK